MLEIEDITSLWTACESRRPKREAELASLLRRTHRDNTVLIMTLNRGHADLLANWIHSCDVHAIEVRSWTVIFAFDDVTAARFATMGFAVYCDAESYGEVSPDAAQQFGDDTFVQLIFPMTAVVRDVLNLGYDVLFQDVDLVWRKDPGEFLFAPARRGFDAQFMYDGPNPIYAPCHANSGFFFLRNSESSRHFWETVYDNFDRMVHYRSQQRVINSVLASPACLDLALDILPEADFANGHLFTLDDVSGLPDDPYVIHCSWTSNIDHKVRKFRLADLWYL